MRIIVVLLLLLSSVAEATHLRSGFITVRRAGPGSLACEITITIYTNEGSEIKFGDGQLAFGDGGMEVTPTIIATPRPDLGVNVGEAIYTTTHIYDGPGRYVVSYLEPNRNAGVVNMFNSVETYFYTESMIDLRAENSPVMQFVAPAVFKATLDKTFSVGLGVADEMDYRLQYSLTSPKKEADAPVLNYWIPAGVSLNPFNGHFTWDMETGTTPMQGEYVFAVRIDAFNQFSELVGYVVFDFQVILEDSGPGGRIVFDRELDNKGRVFTDTEDSVKVIFEADQADWNMNLYAELPDDAVSMTTEDSTANGKFYKVCWVKYTNMVSIQRVNPHVVVVRASRGELNQDITSLFFTTDVDFTDVITRVEKPPLELRLFPNPVLRYLNIHGSGAGLISIFRVTGEHVLTLKYVSGKAVDLGDLPPGLYVARVDGKAFRLVKQ